MFPRFASGNHFSTKRGEVSVRPPACVDFERWEFALPRSPQHLSTYSFYTVMRGTRIDGSGGSAAPRVRVSFFGRGATLELGFAVDLERSQEVYRSTNAIRDWNSAKKLLALSYQESSRPLDAAFVANTEAKVSGEP